MTRCGACVPPGPSKKTAGRSPTRRDNAGNWRRQRSTTGGENFINVKNQRTEEPKNRRIPFFAARRKLVAPYWDDWAVVQRLQVFRRNGFTSVMVAWIAANRLPKCCATGVCGNLFGN